MTHSANQETNIVTVRMAEDPGALARLASTVLRRGYFIESLSAGREQGNNLLRITMKIQGDRSRPFHLIAQQLLKVIDTVEVCIQEERDGTLRELVLARVAWENTTKDELLELVERYGGRIVAVESSEMVVEVSGTAARIDGFLTDLPAQALKETARTGTVSMFRGVPGSEVWIKQ